jgi:hypothetical protein
MSKRTRVGRTALALDDLITRPDAVRLLDELRALNPVDFQDQVDAAAEQVAVGMRRVVERGIMQGFSELIPADAPEWVRIGALTSLADWAAGEARTCLHAPHPSRPQPVAAAAWKPGLITCGHCTHLFRLTDRRADRTCDGCGHVTTGVANGDGITPNIVSMSCLTWMFGCCTACQGEFAVSARSA